MDAADGGQRIALTEAEGRDAVRLLEVVESLHRQVRADGASALAGWAAAVVRPDARPGVANLAHYLALRRRDLSALQDALSFWGLSSLGRCEGHVLLALETLEASLAVLAGVRPSEPVRPAAAWELFAEARRALEAKTTRLFGPAERAAATRVMVTLPSEAADDPGLIGELLDSGADCLRINCAHDGPEQWAAMIRHGREAAAKRNRGCSVLMDLAGPKCRTEQVLRPDKGRLERGDCFRLVRSLPEAGGKRSFATTNFPQIFDQVAVGALVGIDDGKMEGRVVEADGRSLLVEITRAPAKGGKLKPEKGLNFPDTVLDLPPLTEKDLRDLDFVAANADMVGFSFVQRPEDVRWLQQELAARRGNETLMPVVLKIETRLAVRNLPRLIVAAMGRQPTAVMVARGDLAIELGFQRLSEIQEEILWLCEAAHVPVVWATQVVEGLVKEGGPSRAETTDAAMAQRAECVMLNKGPYITEGVRFVVDVIGRMDRHQHKKFARLRALRSWREPQTLTEPAA